MTDNGDNMEVELKKSTHTAEVVPVNLTKIPDSDFLSSCKVADYVCVCRTEDWAGRDKGVYLCPDTLVNTIRPEFSFLMSDAKYDENSIKGGTWARIKAKRFRGTQSYGLLVPCPDGFKFGDDLWDHLELRRYEPELAEQVQSKDKFPSIGGNETASAPSQFYPKYDLDAFLKYGREAFQEGEPTFITLKVNGENARFVYSDGEFHIASHYLWKKEYGSRPNTEAVIQNIREYLTKKEVSPDIIGVRVREVSAKLDKWTPKQNHFWALLRQNEELQKFLVDNPGVMVVAERYGHVKKYPYNCNPGQVKYAAFDLYKDGKYLNPLEARDLGKNLKWVPILHEAFPFNVEKIKEIAETLNQNPIWNVKGIDEGIVLEPLVVRYHDRIGRVKFKLTTPEYHNS